MVAAACPVSAAPQSNQQKIQQARDVLRQAGVQNADKVNIVIADYSRGAGGGDLSTGQYVAPGQTVHGDRYDHPTIILYPEAFGSAGLLQETVRHEMLHYSIDQSGPPAGLDAMWADFKADIASSFDLKEVPKDMQQGVIEVLYASGQNYLEHVFIAKQLMDAAKTVPELQAQVTDIKRLQHEYEKSYKDFLARPQQIPTKQGTYTIRPTSSTKQASDAGAKAPNISGSYECVDGEGCKPSGEHRTGDGQTCGGSETISPLVVEQHGKEVVLRNSYRSVADPCTMDMGGCVRITNAWETVIESVGHGQLQGTLADVQFQSTTRTNDWTVNVTCNGHTTTNTDPGFQREATNMVKLELLGNDTIRLTSEGLTHVYKRTAK